MNSSLGAQNTGKAGGSTARDGSFNKFFSKLWHAVKRKNSAELIAKADALMRRADSLMKAGTNDEKFNARYLYQDALGLYEKASRRSKEPVKAWLRTGSCNLALAEWNDALGLDMDARRECQKAILKVSFVFFWEPQNKEAERIVQSATEYLVATGGADDVKNLTGLAQKAGNAMQEQKRIRPDTQFPYSLS